MAKAKDITNQTFGRLCAIRPLAGSRESRRQWECQCSCGNTTKVDTANLLAGLTLSCGCLWVESMTKHGCSTRKRTTPEYTSWQSMWSRCSRSSNSRYARYGGRGIRVAARWKTFANFLADMGPRPGPGYSIDRINNDGNYEPGNCRWATVGEQNRNNSSTHFVTFKGKTLCVTDWAIELGLNRNTLYQRLRNGWPVERALSVPVQVR